MLDRAYAAASTIRATLTVEQQRVVRVLGVLSIIVLSGLTLSGVWQFFAHESDPTWFDHIRGSDTRQITNASTGVASMHSLFTTAAGALTLVGGAWYAYKVSFSIPWLWVLALGLTIFGSLSGSFVRFNAVKLNGKPYEEAGAGYPQVLFGDVEFVVTDRFDFGALAFRLITISHVATFAVLVGAVWLALPRMADPNR